MSLTRSTAAARVGSDRLSPTSTWLAAATDMPALDGPEGVAERLLLLLHYGIDWTDGWVGRYVATYWDRVLPERVVVATWRSDSLRRWWDEVSGELGSHPRDAAERRELEQLLREPSRPVLEVLRGEVNSLLLRVRIVAEAVRAAKVARVPEHS
jgi:hypothetical protein